MPVEPVVLSRLDVSGEPRCEVRPEEGRVTARVWEEARKALAAEAWTREVAGYRYTLRRYQRTLGPYGHVVISETEEMAHDLDAAFAAVPSETLADMGFVQPMPDSTTRYYAPDAEVLLSDFFLDTHCFATTRDEDSRVGLSFRPIPGRSLPEIRGVLWLNAETFELEELLFDYMNLRSIVERGWAGGKIEVAKLPGGEWIVQRWLMRTPILEVRSRNRIRRTGYLDTGGITTRVIDPEGKVVLGDSLSHRASGTPASPGDLEALPRWRPGPGGGPTGKRALGRRASLRRERRRTREARCRRPRGPAPAFRKACTARDRRGGWTASTGNSQRKPGCHVHRATTSALSRW